MRIRAAIVGDLEKFMKMELQAAGVGVLRGVTETSLRVRDRLRDQVASAGLGPNLEKAWRSNVYENRTIDAAALVYSKAPLIHSAFDEGAEIFPSGRRKWLAIPTPECRALFGYRAGGSLGTRGGNRRRALSPANWPGNVDTGGTTDQQRRSRRRAAQYGTLRPVWRSRPPHLLVVDDVRANRAGQLTRARRAKSGGYLKGTTTVVMFWLVPMVRLKKRLDLSEVSDWAGRELPNAILRAYTAAAGDADTGGEE
jgi:hypothetical protein